MPDSLPAEFDGPDTEQDSVMDLKDYQTFDLTPLGEESTEEDDDSDWDMPGDDGVEPSETAPSASFEGDSGKPIVYRAGKLPQELPSWFGQLDTDHDGQIGLYEWKTSGRPLEEFRWLDRNDDGFLTIDEVLHAVIQAENQSGEDPMARTGYPSFDSSAPD